MTDIVKSISQLIQEQFPSVYKEEGQDLIAFLEAYYEFLESDPKYATRLSRDMFDVNDIDTTLDEFLIHFKQKYLNDFPYVTATDKRFIIKNIMDLYSSKGSEASVKLLFRMLFGEDVDVYYPAQDILKPSDSLWTNPIYIEASYSPRTYSFLNKQITGVNSRATAFVESIVTKRVSGRLVDVLYLSGLRGNFSTGEFISDDGNLRNCPTIRGSMTSFEIINGGRNNKIGDIYDVEYDNGAQGKIRVTGIQNETGRVNFELVDGGHGYTLNGQNAIDAGQVNLLDNPTDVYVSERVLTLTNNKFTRTEIANELTNIVSLITTSGATTTPSRWEYLSKPSTRRPLYDDNLYNFLISIGDDGYFVGDLNKSGNITSEDISLLVSGDYDYIIREFLTDQYIDLEKIVQPLETLELLNASIINEDYEVGNYIVGYNGADVAVANGIIISVANTDAEGTPLDSASANSTMIVQVTTGTFNQQVKIELDPSYSFSNSNIGEYIEEASTVTLTLAAGYQASNYQVGERVSQVKYTPVFDDEGDIIDQYIETYGIGKVISTNDVSNQVVLDPAWGTFTVGAFKDGAETIPMDPVIGANSGYESTLAVGGFEQSSFALGRVSTLVDPTTLIVDDILGEFTPNKFIRGMQTHVEALIQNSSNAVVDTGATEVRLLGQQSANAEIWEIANTYAVGYVTGQNTSAIGLHGITNEFFGGIVGKSYTRQEIAEQILRIAANLSTPSDSKYDPLWTFLTANVNSNANVDGSTNGVTAYDAYLVASAQDDGRFDSLIEPKFIIETTRDEIIRPPTDSQGIIELTNVQVESVSSGIDATFEVGSIEDEEVVELNTDLVGDRNVANVYYLATQLDGQQSGVGFIDSMDIISFVLESDAYYVIDLREDYTYPLDYPTQTGIEDLWENTELTDTNRIPLAYQQDEAFTSTNATGIISWARWEYLNETTSQVETLTRILVRVDTVINTNPGDDPLSTVPIKIGDTLVGDVSGHSRIVTQVKKLSAYSRRGLLVVQGEFDDTPNNDITTADVWGRISKYDETDTSSRIYMYQVNDDADNPGITPTTDALNDTNETYFVINQAEDETIYVRLGQLNSVIDTRRTGYSNNYVVNTFGGGYDGANPILPAFGSLTTDGTGNPYSIEVTSPGVQYFETPELDSNFFLTANNYPIDTANNTHPAQAFAIVNSDHGYGFPKSPNGDNESRLRDVLTIGNFTIGRITSLTDINPGSSYNIDPFVKVQNKYVASYKRGDFYVGIELISGSAGAFTQGEVIYQDIEGIIIDKGIVIDQPTDNRLVVQRIDFGTSFSDGYPIIGESSRARADFGAIGPLEGTNIWGDNAVVSGEVIVADGVATSVEVYDSGFGYEQNQEVEATNPDKDFVITGRSILERQGKGEGFWKSFNSHLNSNKKIRDNDFYQEFSYEILSTMSINRYEDIVKDTLHVAGTKLFGGVVLESEASMRTENFTEFDEIIEVRKSLEIQSSETDLETQDGLEIEHYYKVYRT